jgi:hypothetical protein
VPLAEEKAADRKLTEVADTDFFERADLMDTQVGQQSNKDDPADVATAGFEAMMRGDGDVVSGWKNKLQSAVANVTPAECRPKSTAG